MIPSVGGYVDASLEAILRCAPIWWLAREGPRGLLSEKLGTMGIATFFPSTESMAEIDAMIAKLAARVGAREEGIKVVEKLRARRDAVTRAVASEPRVRTLLVFSVSPIVAAGPQSFPNEMIKVGERRQRGHLGRCVPDPRHREADSRFSPMW